MTASHRATRPVGAASRCSSAPRRLRAAALAASLLVSPAATPAPAQGAFAVGPGHGLNGLQAHGRCATTWDPDGAGPNPPLLVVATTGGTVMAWNGSAFITFGGQATGSVRSLGVYNGQLYAGGTFTRIGTDVVNNVARWDGAHWQPLGTGMTGAGNPGNPNGSVNSLIVNSGLLCIGGTFVPASTGTWTSFATWDGATLTAGPATQAPISQFADFIAGQLFAATTIGVPGVYRYDVILGTGSWTRLGTLADKGILALTSYNGDLVCGGDFTHFFTGVPIVGVARWSGTQWVPMGGGVGPAGSQVASLATYNGVLVAGGEFATADGAIVNNVAQWNGTAWSGMASGVHVTNGGLNGGVMSLAPFNGELVAQGSFDAAAGAPANGIARWNGTTWLPFIPGLNAPVYALLASGSALHAGGDFQFEWGSGTIHHALDSDGSSVSELGTPGSVDGVNGRIRALTLHAFDLFFGPHVIVGGSFSLAGGLSASNVAGYSFAGGWEPLGNGFNDVANALADYGGAIWAAGNFTASGATPINRLAKYGSAGWADAGFGSFLTLYTLTVANGRLIIGGEPGPNPRVRPTNGVSAWDGTTLSYYGMANGPVYALTTLNGNVVAAGAFTFIGGVAAAGIAIRDEATGAWSAMGSGFPLGVPYALAVHGGNLYAGGTIMFSGIATYGNVFRWNGSAWVGLSGGLDGPVYALASFGTDLEIGGDFRNSNTGVQSPYWIRYSDGVLAVDRGPRSAGLALGESRPNPAHSVSRIEFSLERAGRARLAIHDLAGRRVRMLADGWFEPGAHTAMWDGADNEGHPSAAGLYFYRLESGDRSTARRVVLTR